MKDSCIFYRDWLEGMKSFEPSLRLELLEAVLSFALNGSVSELSPQASMLFSLLKPKIERDNLKYEERRLRNQTNGMKGGRPPKKETRNNPNNPKNPVGFRETQNNPKNPVGCDNVNDNVSQEPKGSMSENKTLLSEGMSDSVAVPTQPKTFRDKVIVSFNAAVSGRSIKPIRSISEGTQRAEWLKARRREYGDDAIEEMFEKAAHSSFLNGNNRKGWTATFDWLIRPNNFPKVLEGNYDDGKVNEKTIELQTDWQS